MIDKENIKAPLFFILQLCVFLFLPFSSLLQLLLVFVLQIIYWISLPTKFPHLCGIYPNNKLIRDVLLGLSLPIIFFLPYFIFIVDSGYQIEVHELLGEMTFNLILISIIEELVFRGFFFFFLAKRFGFWVPTFLLSTLFGLIHLYNPNTTIVGFINTASAGILLSTLAFKTRSLVLPIIFHILWNTIQGPLLDLPVSGYNYPGILSHDISFDSALWGGYYGPESGLWATIFLIVSTIGLYVKLQPSLLLNEAWIKYTNGNKNSIT